jgi:hypothetical protein
MPPKMAGPPHEHSPLAPTPPRLQPCRNGTNRTSSGEVTGGRRRMKNDQFIDAVQTIGIITIALVLSYVVVRLEGTLVRAADRLKKCLFTKTKSLRLQIA